MAVQIELHHLLPSGVRMAISPLWETVGSLALLAKYGEGQDLPWPYDIWASSAVASFPRPTESAEDLLHLFRGLPPGAVPMFMLPPPGSCPPTLDAELNRVRSQPAHVVEMETAERFSGCKPLQRFADDPHASLDWFADQLHRYWRAAIRPVWVAMRAALEEEILHRGHVLATRGTEVLLSGLHSRIQWRPPTLLVAGGPPLHENAVNRQLVLVPVLFGRGPSMVSVDPATDRIALSYPARGAAVLASLKPAEQDGAGNEPRAADQLGTLVGRRRAAILRSLTLPTTTTALAGVLGLANSTVSQHLTTLVAAGVAQRRRHGGRALYELSAAGHALLGHLDGGSQPPGPLPAG